MNFWDFLASEQFKTIIAGLNALVILVILPLYRGIKKHIDALKRIPLIEQILVHHDERIGNLEVHVPPPPPPPRVYRWPAE